MTDIINLNSIRSDNCDCNKPKPEKHLCGCNNHNPQPCHLVTDQGDQYFKVKNLFGELKSEWQRTEARSNLGVTDIIDFKLIKFGEGSGDTNIWLMLTSKGGSLKTYDFIVANGEKGESATIEIIDLEALSPEANPTFTNIGTPSHAKYILGIPRGHNGLSAYQIYLKNGGTLPEEDWLLSLKGKDGEEGPAGPAGPMGPAGADSDMYQPTSIIPLRVDNNLTLDISDGNVFLGDLLVYKMVLKNGLSLYFSTPYKIIGGGGGGGGPQQYKYNLFMFKLVDFQTRPSEAWIASTISELRQQIDSKTKEELESLLWSTSAPRVETPSEQFIFMATCVVTNGEYGDWSVVCLTGAKGNPGADGTSGEGEQGLMGPVIRISTYDSNNPQRRYKNQATVTEGYSLTDIRYIDVVYYDDNNPDTSNFWMPKPQLSKDDYTVGPPNANTWDEAQGYDFLFVQTLIANYLAAYTVDTSEVRIHTNLGQDDDAIVAGMTGGKPVLNTPTVLNDSSNPVRIWAGNETSVHDTSMNIIDAPFRVYQDGHLFANDADIEGTVLANILRLGKHLRTVNSILLEGTFLAPTNESEFTLPELHDDRVLMFYLLTNLVTSEGEIQVNAYNGNWIKEADALSNSTYFMAKYEKLYLLFGIDKVWYVVESDMKAASEQIPDTRISLATASRAGDSICHGVSIIDNLSLHRIWNFLTPTLNISNLESNPTLFVFPSSKTYYLYALFNRTTDNVTKTYLKEVGTILLQFVSPRYNFGSIVIAGNTTLSNESGTNVNNVWEFTVRDYENNEDRKFGVKISTREISDINADDETMILLMSENQKYDDAFEHEIQNSGAQSLDQVTECLPMSTSAVTYITLLQRDTSRLLGTIRPNN